VDGSSANRQRAISCDGISGDNAIAGVAVCMPEMAEILAKLHRDTVERGNGCFDVYWYTLL
jgi:hypothetical protein